MIENVPFATPVAVESFPPFLPGYNQKNVDDAKTYKIFEVNLLRRQENLAAVMVDSLLQRQISYYISDGFTRCFFEWDQSKTRYPAIVADRTNFFQWLHSHAHVIARFYPENDHIQPAVLIYKLNIPAIKN
jgi:hypothetical protein